jgi:dienelactone hydrolase
MNDSIDDVVRIDQHGVTLEAFLWVPRNPIGLVIFAHGSGSSRHSPRNQFVAHQLNNQRIATILADLLSPYEDLEYEMRFDIGLITERLLGVTRWAVEQPNLSSLPLGYFGASTGAAAALEAAAALGDGVKAVVSRGGRPDLACGIAGVTAPTLLIVGGNDYGVIELNEQAYGRLRAPKDLAIVSGATHLFEEPGTLERASDLAADWFLRSFILASQEPNRRNEAVG